jgi:cytochrome o ubiquinol oxidase subunit 2
MLVSLGKALTKVGSLLGRRHTLTRFFWLILGTFLALTLTGCKGHLVGMLDPKGVITYQERKLFFDTLALMLIVVIPVIIMSLTFIYHYQVSHRTTDYKPNWAHSYFLESLWWGIPCAIILILGVITWRTSHELDPYKPITGHGEKTMVVYAIALPWKWLFIYQEQNIATVNYLEMPVDQQVEFWITTDNVPMSAFFIPQLGSQIYAMAGMRTRLHLVANEIGNYVGLNTQYNGFGFSEMQFITHVVSPEDMQKWVETTQKSTKHLTPAAYLDLLNQSVNNPPEFYSGVPEGLFDEVINLYMNSTGTVHPRNNQLRLHYEIK